MKKYFSFIALAMMVAFSTTFVSCSSDDSDEVPSIGEGYITVNGTEQELFSTLFSWEDMTSIWGPENFVIF